MTTATKTTKKKATSKKRVSTKKKAAAKKNTTSRKKTPSKSKVAKPKASKPSQATKNVEGNPYRQGSGYNMAFGCLLRLGKDKPVSRKALLAAYCKASGKDEKRAKYDLAVILSPTQDGVGHRSSRKDSYYVERLENSMVRLHMVK